MSANFPPQRPAARPPIAVLDPAVVEQIAAGEVIDRPASVVKELVENALDAGATRITIELQQGGLRLIRVVDDGCGMTADQARLSLERHATSKLTRVADLDRLATLGFRGEGLPSVAAVSRLSLTTRSAAARVGVAIQVEAGRVLSEQPAGCAAGTAIAASELFFNIPARRKFLRSTATEAGHVQELIAWLACAFPEVGFTLLHEGRRVLDLPAVAGRSQRAQGLAAARGQPPLVGRASRSGVAVEAVLQPLEHARSSGRALLLLVNRRVVRDRALLQGALAGCGSRLPSGRFPAGVIYLEVDAGRVDVNVHPQKREVRFAEPQQVRAAVVAAVAQAVGGGPSPEPGASLEAVASAPAPSLPPAARIYGLRAADGAGSSPPRSAAAFDGPARAAEAQRRFWSASGPRHDDERDFGLGAALACVVPEAAPVVRCQPLGWTGEGLLVAQWGERLVVIDEETGWCAVVLEALRREQTVGPALSRALAPPVVIALDSRAAEALAARRSALQALGFELEPFDAGAWLLRRRPAAAETEGPTLAAVVALLARRWAARTSADASAAGVATELCDEVLLAVAWAIARTRRGASWRPQLAAALERCGAEALQWWAPSPGPSLRPRGGRPTAMGIELAAFRAQARAEP